MVVDLYEVMVLHDDWMRTGDTHDGHLPKSTAFWSIFIGFSHPQKPSDLLGYPPWLETSVFHAIPGPRGHGQLILSSPGVSGCAAFPAAVVARKLMVTATGAVPISLADLGGN